MAVQESLSVPVVVRVQESKRDSSYMFECKMWPQYGDHI